MFKNESDLLWSSMTLKLIYDLINNLRLHNVSIYEKLYQNMFTKASARKNKAKILQLRSPVYFWGDVEELNNSLHPPLAFLFL